MNTATNRLHRSFLGSLAFICATTCSTAEAIEADVVDDQVLAPYVVVATRTPLDLERVSPSVSYIAAAEMDQWKDRSLIDTLRRQTGLSFKLNGTPGSVTSLFVRGANSDQTGFFLDGRRLNPGFGNQFNIEALSIDNLSSVQILRGASSVNYGSSGIGGVVNLQTQSSIGEAGYRGAIGAELGSHQYARAAVATTVSTKAWGVGLGVSTLTTDNDRVNDAYQHDSLNARFDYKISEDLYFELIAMYTNADKEVAGPQSRPTNQDHQNNQNWLISPGFQYTTDLLSVHAFYSRTSATIENDIEDYLGSIYGTKAEVESDEVNLQADYRLTDELLLTAGAVYRNDYAYDRNLNAYSSDLPVDQYTNNAGQAGVWSQVLSRMSEVFEIRGSARFDTYTDYDDSINGSLEVIYHHLDMNGSLFAKIASSYSPPSALDLAYDENLDSNNNPNNTTLNPEESMSYEFGIRQTLLNDALEYSVVLFHNDIDDLIVYESYDDGNYNYWSDTYNVGEATTQGIELMLQYAVSAQFNLGINYTYLTAEDDDLDQRLAYRPRHLLQLTAMYQPVEFVTLGMSGIGHYDRERNIYQSPNEDVEDFFVIDLFVDWVVSDQLTLFGRVDNILDEHYASTYGYPALGMTGYVGARLSF